MQTTSAPPKYPTLSYLELKTWVSKLLPALQGARIDRVFVPSSAEHPDLYFKKEWVFDLNLPQSSGALYLSLRPQASGILILPTRSFKPESTGSRSGFDLSLHKHLVGTKITGLRTVDGERLVILEMTGSDQFELHLHLIPSKPLGVLLVKKSEAWQVLSATDQRDTYETPPPRTLTAEALLKVPNRSELTASLSHYQKLWFDAQRETALLQRRQRLAQALNTQLESIQSKSHSLQEQLRKTDAEADWNYFGSLLQVHFYAKPEVQNGVYSLQDYEKDKTILVPADPKLNLKQQLERFFHLAKRKKKRLEESSIRIASLNEKANAIQAKIQALADAKTLPELLALEPKKEILKGKEHKKLAEFTGKQYRSREGLTILAGRNLTENLELTFKIARGNDLWFHVKGRPGSHTVVILPSKKTASLDTLLDAAHLCILHSGGKEWGKTEVDYTFRKHVKKIKNQTEVTYTHNKTLMVLPEPERLTRLYASE